MQSSKVYVARDPTTGISHVKRVEHGLFAALIIVTILTALYWLSVFVSSFLHLPSSLNIPFEVRIVGFLLVASAIPFTSWIFRYRKPSEMILSTYFTFAKLFRRVPITAQSLRREALITKGPQKYVRHPLYFGLMVIVFGWGLLTVSTYYFVLTLFLLVWFRFILIPFEEKELCALFGDQYRKYMENTPMLVPVPKVKTTF